MGGKTVGEATDLGYSWPGAVLVGGLAPVRKGLGERERERRERHAELAWKHNDREQGHTERVGKVERERARETVMSRSM